MEPRDLNTLTPREQQVLDMLKRGYSNRDIAAELQISLSGAKYHVSEIISRLGVSSREEAAGLERTSRRWSFLPLSLPGSRLRISQLLAIKVAVLALAVGGIGFGGVLLAGWVKGDATEPGSEAGAAFDPCAGDPRCSVPSEVEYATLEEAAAHASFEPMMPAFIPDGFAQKQVLAKQRDYTNPYVPEVHNDWITVVYRDGAGNRLVISQGFPPQISARYSVPGVNSVQSRLEVNGHEALSATSAPVQLFPVFNLEEDIGPVVTVFVGRFGSGWGQEGSLFSGSPMEYSIASDSLGLEDLIAIARSVTFPETAEPNEGFTPAPYFE